MDTEVRKKWLKWLKIVGPIAVGLLVILLVFIGISKHHQKKPKGKPQNKPLTASISLPLTTVSVDQPPTEQNEKQAEPGNQLNPKDLTSTIVQPSDDTSAQQAQPPITLPENEETRKEATAETKRELMQLLTATPPDLPEVNRLVDLMYQLNPNLAGELENERQRLESEVVGKMGSYSPGFTLPQIDELVRDLICVRVCLQRNVETVPQASDLVGEAYQRTFTDISSSYKSELGSKCTKGEPVDDVVSAWHYWYDQYKDRITVVDPLLTLKGKDEICALLTPPATDPVITPPSPSDVVIGPPVLTPPQPLAPQFKHTVQINDQTPFPANIFITPTQVVIFTPKSILNLSRRFLLDIAEDERKGGERMLLWFQPFMRLYISPVIPMKHFATYTPDVVEPVNVNAAEEPQLLSFLTNLLQDELQHLVQQATGQFRITSVNKEYNLCKSYPSSFIVPKNIDDSALAELAGFRRKERIPMVAYASSKVVLVRSAEPMVSKYFLKLKWGRCTQDEQFLKEATLPGGQLLIVDLRDEQQADLARLVGGGTEKEGDYAGATKLFLNLAKTQIVRVAEQQLIQGKDAEWIGLIRKILQGVWKLYDMIQSRNEAGQAVTIEAHCMDGWDRTPQVMSLLQIMLDARYRTRKGLAALLEKDWLAAGHQFHVRPTPPYSGSRSLHEVAPVWAQLLNVLWVWIRARPELFEYEEVDLMMLWRESFSGSFCGYGEGDPVRREKELQRALFWKAFLARPPKLPTETDITIVRDAEVKVLLNSNLDHYKTNENVNDNDDPPLR